MRRGTLVSILLACVLALIFFTGGMLIRFLFFGHTDHSDDVTEVQSSESTYITEYDAEKLSILNKQLDHHLNLEPVGTEDGMLLCKLTDTNISVIVDTSGDEYQFASEPYDRDHPGYFLIFSQGEPDWVNLIYETDATMDVYYECRDDGLYLADDGTKVFDYDGKALTPIVKDGEELWQSLMW